MLSPCRNLEYRKLQRVLAIVLNYAARLVLVKTRSDQISPATDACIMF